MTVKFAFASVPKDGGTFTFYRNLRPALLGYGIDMRCVSVGKAQAELWEDTYKDEGCVLLAPNTRNIKKQAMAFVDWCEVEQVDIVMGVNSEAILSSIPHLPEHIRVLSRCANGFDHGYRIALSGMERLTRIVAISPRLERDLITQYGVNPELLTLIPNGIDPKPFEQAAGMPRGQKYELQLGFLGRLEHNQKGVFHLPEIVRELNGRGIAFTLRIAGKGKHRRRLEDMLSDGIESGQVRFLGPLSPDEVPNFLSDIDIFLFPSHFEGFPNALLEAMLAGCIPASWLIEGITDFIVEDGETGIICTTGNYSQLADRIAALVLDRENLKRMSEQAAQIARQRFTDRKAAEAYASLIKEVISESSPPWTPKSWEHFMVDPNFEHGMKEIIKRTVLVHWLKEKILGDY